MKIATIVPTKHLHLIEKDPYHLCLAHQVLKDPLYAMFFMEQRKVHNHFVIMDNGAAETGKSLPTSTLIRAAMKVQPNEMVLPDTIKDMHQTLLDSEEALNQIRRELPHMRLMGVPQGRTKHEWMQCLLTMISWGVDTIGVSKFTVPEVFASRVHAIDVMQGLDADIHILGSADLPGEIHEMDYLYPDRVRGTDSGIAAIYAQDGREIIGPRPDHVIDLDAELDEDLLSTNIQLWLIKVS